MLECRKCKKNSKIQENSLHFIQAQKIKLAKNYNKILYFNYIQCYEVITIKPCDDCNMSRNCSTFKLTLKNCSIVAAAEFLHVRIVVNLSFYFPSNNFRLKFVVKCHSVVNKFKWQ